MSITQARLRQVILAGEDFRQALESLKARVKSIAELDPSPQAFAQLAALDPASLLLRPADSIRVLAEESMRLRLTWAKNQSRIRRWKQKRATPDPDLEAFIKWKEEEDEKFQEREETDQWKETQDLEDYLKWKAETVKKTTCPGCGYDPDHCECAPT